MWDLPGLESELVSPALTGGFLATVPPGKSLLFFFSLNFIHSIWFPIWFLVVYPLIFSIPCSFPNFSSVMIRKKTTIQLTHEQQLILSHKMEPLQVVKIMAFAGKGLLLLKAPGRCLPLPSTCWSILPSPAIPLLQFNHLKSSCQGIIAFSYHSREHPPWSSWGQIVHSLWDWPSLSRVIVSAHTWVAVGQEVMWLSCSDNIRSSWLSVG